MCFGPCEQFPQLVAFLFVVPTGASRLVCSATMAFMHVDDAKTREDQRHESISCNVITVKYWRYFAAASEARSVHKRKPRLQRTKTYELLATTSHQPMTAIRHTWVRYVLDEDIDVLRGLSRGLACQSALIRKFKRMVGVSFH